MKDGEWVMKKARQPSLSAKATSPSCSLALSFRCSAIWLPMSLRVLSLPREVNIGQKNRILVPVQRKLFSFLLVYELHFGWVQSLKIWSFCRKDKNMNRGQTKTGFSLLKLNFMTNRFTLSGVSSCYSTELPFSKSSDNGFFFFLTVLSGDQNDCKSHTCKLRY